jgi:3D-(3,5/4)-trihydroxycyclohexane-1,2-dione acylhydrolase (decyclizing)
MAEGGEVNKIDFAMHAAAMGADAVHVKDLPELKSAMVKARAARRTQVLVIDTTHARTTREGGCWWEVGIPEVSERAEINAAYANSLVHKEGQRV